MVLIQNPTPIHWNYFLALEDDLYHLSRYVEFDPDNYDTFSIEIAHLLMSASAEVDSVLRQLCQKIEPGQEHRNIPDYYGPVTRYSNKFINFELEIPRFGVTLHPWENWTQQQAPFWWRANNSVKHHRHTEFNQATLKNCLNAMAGLLVSVLHLYADEGKTGALTGIPKLFSVAPESGGGQQWGATGHCQLFFLRDSDNPFYINRIHTPPPI